MPKLVCLCGYVHDLSRIPDAGWVMVKDQHWEELIELEARRKARSNAEVWTPEHKEYIAASDRAGDLQQRLYECPKCLRLARLSPRSVARYYKFDKGDDDD